MPPSRFPLRRYLRQLADMEQEFRFWSSHYALIADRTPFGYEALPYERRSQLLEQLRPRIHELFHELEGLPRLS